MDPKASRFLWTRIGDILKKGQSVVLTSHSMFECEALCQRIGIMVAGRLRCLGSPQHLKSKYGFGYTLVMKVSGQTARAKSFVCSAFADAILEEEYSGYLHFMLPAESIKNLALAFESLERAKKSLGVEHYQLGQTSLDEVFCKFAREEAGETEEEAAGGRRELVSEDGLKTAVHMDVRSDVDEASSAAEHHAQDRNAPSSLEHELVSLA